MGFKEFVVGNCFTIDCEFFSVNYNCWLSGFEYHYSSYFHVDSLEGPAFSIFFGKEEMNSRSAFLKASVEFVLWKNERKRAVVEVFTGPTGSIDSWANVVNNGLVGAAFTIDTPSHVNDGTYGESKRNYDFFITVWIMYVMNFFPNNSFSYNFE
jgi:hypothetical protein